MPDEPVPDDVAGLRAVNARLRAVVEAKDAEIAALRAERDADREALRLIGLQVAELQRRLGMDSSNSGTPTSKEGIGAGEERKARQRSERERRKDRRPGGQPGHPGKGLVRDPDPGEKKEATPPVECRKCKGSLDGVARAGQRWAQSWDVRVTRVVTEWLLPGLACPCCGEVTFAAPPPGLHAGSVSYGPGLNAAAVVLTACGNVPPGAGRAGHRHAAGRDGLGRVGRQGQRPAVSAAGQGGPGRGDARRAGLPGRAGSRETPVNVLGKGTAPQPAAQEGQEERDPEEKDGKAAAGAPHVLIVRTPDGLLTWLAGIGSGRLAGDFTVVTYARRGVARNPVDGPVDDANRICADVEDAAALIARCGGGPACVFGSSSGAIVTLDLVTRHPDLVSTAVVHEPPILELLDDPDAWAVRFAGIFATYQRMGCGRRWRSSGRPWGLQAGRRPASWRRRGP